MINTTNSPEFIEVKNNEYIIFDQTTLNYMEEKYLITKNLGDSIAYRIYSEDLKKVALARHLDEEQFKKLFNELNPDNIKTILDVKFVGGSPYEKSNEEISILSNNLISYFIKIDTEKCEKLAIKDYINITAWDCYQKPHPESFTVSCYHGGISAFLGDDSEFNNYE